MDNARGQLIQTYRPEFKAQCVAEYVAGASEWAIAKKYKVTRQTVHNWVLEAGAQRGGAMTPDARNELESLLFTHLRTSMQTLTAMMDHFGDKDWLEKQTAGDLALLFTTVNDKTVHLLASLEPPEQDQEDEDDGMIIGG